MDPTPAISMRMSLVVARRQHMVLVTPIHITKNKLCSFSSILSNKSSRRKHLLIPMTQDLKELRNKISSIDQEILILLSKRMNLAGEVAEYKLEN